MPDTEPNPPTPIEPQPAPVTLDSLSYEARVAAFKADLDALCARYRIQRVEVMGMQFHFGA